MLAAMAAILVILVAVGAHLIVSMIV